MAEIITLRAIALKLARPHAIKTLLIRRDHNATSYSTETSVSPTCRMNSSSRDHNATSYSTETLLKLFPFQALAAQRS